LVLLEPAAVSNLYDSSICDGRYVTPAVREYWAELKKRRKANADEIQALYGGGYDSSIHDSSIHDPSIRFPAHESDCLSLW